MKFQHIQEKLVILLIKFGIDSAFTDSLQMDSYFNNSRGITIYSFKILVKNSFYSKLEYASDNLVGDPYEQKLLMVRAHKGHLIGLYGERPVLYIYSVPTKHFIIGI